MAKSESIKELAAALSKAQGEFPTIAKNKTAKVPMKAGGQYSYRYADLADVISATAPVLSRNGLGISQVPTISNGKLVLETTLMHASGEWISSEYPLATHDRPQEMGSEITYGRRYTMTSVLGIHGDEDDDGALAQNAPRPQAMETKRSEPTKPSPFETLPISEYTATFGKYKGQKLKDIDIYDLNNYVKYIKDSAERDKKEIQGQVLSFVNAAETFVNSRAADSIMDHLRDEHS